ncbi:hypothetical protein DENSPDRAFT_839639 [Dentipellis sp. KUC8613]|nr:hypothetical protein DENSPDRAFT_839639 [Dentipellis sp. KUC8613]
MSTQRCLPHPSLTGISDMALASSPQPYACQGASVHTSPPADYDCRFGLKPVIRYLLTCC